MKYLSRSLKTTPAVYMMCFTSVFLLTSCMNNNMADLEQYVDKQRQKTPEKIQPLPDVKTFSFYTYNEAGLRNPFVNENINITQSIEECPQVVRSKTTLETIPLDSLILVGSLEQDGERWALVKDPERTVHRLKQGEYLGQNNGRIMRITDNEVVLQEMVSDRMEGCQKRQTTLAIAAQ